MIIVEQEATGLKVSAKLNSVKLDNCIICKEKKKEKSQEKSNKKRIKINRFFLLVEFERPGRISEFDSTLFMKFDVM